MAKRKPTNELPDQLLTDENAERFRQLELAQRNRGKKSEKKPTEKPPVPAITIEPAPEAKAKEPLDRVPALKAKYQAVTDEFKARCIERDSVRQRVSMAREVLGALEAACGLLPAKTIIACPNDGGEWGGGSLLERFESIKDDKERTRFFKAHRSELEKLINKQPNDDARRI